jgi:hypothetical protein
MKFMKKYYMIIDFNCKLFPTSIKINTELKKDFSIHAHCKVWIIQDNLPDYNNLAYLIDIVKNIIKRIYMAKFGN